MDTYVKWMKGFTTDERRQHSASFWINTMFLFEWTEAFINRIMLLGWLPLDSLKLIQIHYIWSSLSVSIPLETYWEALCQILTLGNALGLDLSPFLELMSAFIFLILEILKYMGVYDDI